MANGGYGARGQGGAPPSVEDYEKALGLLPGQGAGVPVADRTRIIRESQPGGLGEQDLRKVGDRVFGEGRGYKAGEALQSVAKFVAPQSPVEVGLMALGPLLPGVAKVAPKVGGKALGTAKRTVRQERDAYSVIKQALQADESVYNTARGGRGINPGKPPLPRRLPGGYAVYHGRSMTPQGAASRGLPEDSLRFTRHDNQFHSPSRDFADYFGNYRSIKQGVEGTGRGSLTPTELYRTVIPSKTLARAKTGAHPWSRSKNVAVDDEVFVPVVDTFEPELIVGKNVGKSKQIRSKGNPEESWRRLVQADDLNTKVLMEEDFAPFGDWETTRELVEWMRGLAVSPRASKRTFRKLEKQVETALNPSPDVRAKAADYRDLEEIMGAADAKLRNYPGWETPDPWTGSMTAIGKAQTDAGKALQNLAKVGGNRPRGKIDQKAWDEAYHKALGALENYKNAQIVTRMRPSRVT